MSDQTQLAVQEPSVASMLHGVIEKGITTENVAALDKLVGLYERMEARKAEQEFARAFVDLQSEMPRIEATRAVPNKDGTLRYRFAPYEAIMAQVQPILTKHGFTVTFDTKFAEGRITSVCTLMHTGGHSRSNEFAVRIGHGPPSASEAQADGSAQTYSKRFALCNALNIVVANMDDDARMEGGFITPEQAAELRRRVKATGSDEVKFLAHANAPTYEEIRESRFDILDSGLRKREAKGKPSEKRDADGNFVF